MCRELGCTMAQGYYVAKPTVKISHLKDEYLHIKDLYNNSKRTKENEYKDIKSRIEKIKDAPSDMRIFKILERFKKSKNLKVIPIVGNDGIPKGIIKESSVKDYIYSPYGWSLLEHDTRKNLLDFISLSAIVDIHDNLEQILKVYASNIDSEGVLVTKNGKYYGYISDKELLGLISEKNLLDAKDQNPLTKLPGNIAINEFLSLVNNSSNVHTIAYFDLDNFKPFNDYYGFRNGDRVIKLLGNIMQKSQNRLNAKSIVGHIGGDDFFFGWQTKDTNFTHDFNTISNIVKNFAINVESFYNKEDREKGFIISKNRKGEDEKFPLITVSAALLFVVKNKNADEISEICAKLKKQAKRLGGNMVITASV